ncbi:MAG: hypothetical protein ACKO96_29545 [Flammeovirgaceae bacterium]
MNCLYFNQIEKVTLPGSDSPYAFLTQCFLECHHAIKGKIAEKILLVPLANETIQAS